MSNMSSKMMSGDGDSPTFCEVISEIHGGDTQITSNNDYSNFATLKLPSRRHSASSSDAFPHVDFKDPMENIITKPPTRKTSSGEDEIITEDQISVSTQTEEAIAASQAVYPDANPKNNKKNDSKDGCGVTCLAYTLECCECTVM